MMHSTLGASGSIYSAQLPSGILKLFQAWDSACSPLRNGEDSELQQQLTDARCVIQQLAGQVDHLKNVQTQLAGMILWLEKCNCSQSIPPEHKLSARHHSHRMCGSIGNMGRHASSYVVCISFA